jgi:polyisoprenoid-binding protein YceI
LLTILVYRGGTLAKAGHNHVIASHDLTGTVYVPADSTQSAFDLRVPVADLTVDEPELRAKEGPDFPPAVPDSAKEGTRRNMLGEALLDATRYAEITLRSERLEPAGNRLEAHVQVRVRDQAHSIVVPVHYELTTDELVASGELPLKQSDLGLTPFSALLGALQVQDEMKIRFRILARAARTNR